MWLNFPVMSVLELTDKQVLSLVRQLPTKSKRTALLALAQEAQVRRDERLRAGEAQLRRVAKKRGLDWSRLSEDKREALANQLMHED